MHSWSKQVVENSPYCIAQVQIITNENHEPVDYMYTYVNEAYAQVAKLKKENIIGKRATEIATRITSLGFDWIGFLSKVNMHDTFDETVQSVGGGKYIRLVAYKVGKNEVAFSFIDISNQVNSLELHQHFFDLTPTPLLILSLDGIILKANNEWLNVFDYTPQYLVNKSIFDFIHPDGLDALKNCLTYGDKDGYTCDVVNKVRAFDDSYKDMSWKAYHAPTYILAAGVDITQMKKKERALKRQIETQNLFMNTTITGIFQMMLDEPLDPNTFAFSDQELDEYMKKERIVSVNNAFVHHYRQSKEELLGKTLFDLYNLDREEGRNRFKQSIVYGEITGEIRMKLPDGTFTFLYVDITALKDSKGRIVGHMGLQIEINERKKSEAALQKSEAKFRILGEYASDMIWIYDFNAQGITYISPAVKRLLGYSVQEIQKRDYTKTVIKEDVKKARRYIISWAREYKKTKKINDNWSLQLRHEAKDGHIVWIESRINFKMNELGVIEIIGVSRDITDKKRAQEELLFTNYHDALTTVYNRRYCDEHISEFTTPTHFPLAIISCDVNGLKLANDVFGHAVGDALLSNTGSLLQSYVPKDGIVVREGGDEFLIILPNTTHKEATQLVDSMKKESKTLYANNLSLSLSFGIGIMDSINQSYEEVHALSEHHLYTTKLVESSLYKEKIITLLIQDLFDKYDEIRRHSETVALLSQVLADALGLDEHDTQQIYLAGKFHDIGKIGLDETFINPPEFLDKDQIFLLQRHSELGFHILKSAQHYGKIADWVLNHHEQPDGKGYPRGLTKNEIPLQSHILNVANEFDRILWSNKELSIDSVIASLLPHSGTMYDERVLHALESIPHKRLKEIEGV